MGDEKGCCGKPEEKKEKPEGCSTEKKECSGDAPKAPCCPKKD